MMRKRLPSAVLMGILAAALLMGCSIKEDRSACPCVLALDFSGVDRDRSDSLSLGVLSAGGFLYTDIVPSTSYARSYTVDVPKGDIWVYAYSIDSDGEELFDMLSPDRSSLSIPYGMECPEVNMFCHHSFMGEETVTLPVVLHKNYCRLAITMVNEDEIPLRISILGEISGYGKEGVPASGDFLFEPDGNGTGLYYVRIPRQVDSSLKLDLSDEDGTLREFAIGEYILESGYDWEAEDLDDVQIQIDYAKSNVTFDVDGWVKSVEIEVVI